MQKVKKGFTLIEIIVAVSIIGVISSIILADIGGARYRAKAETAKVQLAKIAEASEMFRLHIGEYPQGDSKWKNGNQMYFSQSNGDPRCEAGLECRVSGDAEFFPGGESFGSHQSLSHSGWRGPYMTDVPLDPWGNPYWFDGDHPCSPEVEGCEGIDTGGSNCLAVLGSGGPDGGGYNYTNDSRVVLIVQNTC